ncbi:unnamed protein product [Rotaria magnacalcarata]|uniref:Uncharacterized protein n=1 Tax=Rotaria magnacalcarata TaxID=392030 RepID=A0A819B112_9BILA|nr:unnamed protein product [Rotaria magnacalcarata]CAF3793802.1 unnamed protein product [Rotaria magnacalcarata]
MKRRTSEDESEQAQKIAPAQAQEEVEPEAEEEVSPELVAMIGALSPALNAAVASGDAGQVRGIIQQYDDYVDEMYSDDVNYSITPNIETHLDHLGAYAHLLGFHAICDIFHHEECELSQVQDQDVAEVQDQGVAEEAFPEFVARIEALSPALNVAVAAGDADQVRGIIQQYDDHVTEIYSEHEGYDFTPTIQTQLEVLGERAHLLGFHEICSILYYDECDVAVEEIGVVADHGAIEY